MRALHRRRLLGWGGLGLAALLGVAWLARLDYPRKISTDVLDLIPAGERAPELALVRQLAAEAEARVMLFVLTDPRGAPAPLEAGRQFSAALVDSRAFTEAMPLADATNREAIGRVLFEHRFTLLFPPWLREREAAFLATRGETAAFGPWLAADTAARLGRFLEDPAAIAWQDVVPADPLLLLPGTLNRLKSGLAFLQPEPAAGSPLLVWGRIAASPLSEAGQAPVFSAIAQAAAATRARFPGLAVADTGINRFAAASRARIEREMTWLNTLSFVAVLGIALAFIRGAHRGLHLVPVVLLSILGAWVTVTVAFERLHILVFVVGSLLTGVAIDYGFYLYMQRPAYPGEDYWGKVRRLMKPLLASCFTTVAGFALLLASDLPFIRQLGAFVGAGLLCALVAAVGYFSTVGGDCLEAREFRGGRALAEPTRRKLRRGLLGAWLLAVPGLFLVTWKDDVRELEIPSPALRREDARIRALAGEVPGRTVFLTHGDSVAEARASLEQFHAWLGTAGGGGTEFTSLGALVPTSADYERARAFAREQPRFPAALGAALAGAGFEAEAFAPFSEAYRHFAAGAGGQDVAPAVRALHDALGGPASALLHIGRPFTWFVTIASRAPAASPPAGLRTVSANQLQSLNQVFRRYRQSALRLSATGLAIVGLGVFLTYGWRDGLRIFAIPCGACLGIFGLFGWLGQPLNLFHLLGAFLGVCLTHNYSIFSATSAFRREPPPASVRLSALTTAASFAVLALSGIPVVRALGLTVATMVLAALLVIELEHLRPLAERP